MVNLVQQFVQKVIEEGAYEEQDYHYLVNRVFALVGETQAPAKLDLTQNIDMKDELVSLAIANGKISDLADDQDILGAQLMDLMTPPPSQVNRVFWKTYKDSPERAIADFHQLSKANDYIKTRAIAQNIGFETVTDYGNLEITINLSKPEKDPKAIAAAKAMPASSYPKCMLCLENEGYLGRIGYPARTNHRIIRFDLQGTTWGFQYSPYAYFNEHCIFLHGQHVPMSITPKTFGCLLDIVEQFPGYFAGSNADLPIVGGSILTHDHYQGGRHTFAMEKAPIETALRFEGFETVEAGIVKWPMSVIRLRSKNKHNLIQLAEKILTTWWNYSDPELQIKAETDGTPHHTVTPIARRVEGVFELDLVLRDNQTSDEFPDGIYHPHPDVQHIKKENIGLIEVMGLAILPPRLKTEMEEVADYLLGKSAKVAAYHQDWADQIKANHQELTEANVTDIINLEIGLVFSRVLEDAGVYKRTEEGQAGFIRFAEAVGLV
ncbi:UDP-glucose--hexose-1-phosphate uridylyltransferase [Streptococcus merionis]|uniref:UDP-glucose--hexose-1-phosphate uridylyltransferase n=1 Tax=Streptococcus merionis TaxID=400065 RepID=UPI0026F1C332|nr:UDP-glucose--hexose-1-phosphate uridylyltransferase [Streptococcus merionis]